MRVLRKIFEFAVFKLLKVNEYESLWLRRYFASRYGISVGMYSYGCFDMSRIPRGTVVGRYCSFARTATIFNGNHGVGYRTTHPYLYNTNLGMVKKETISRTVCVIEDDVWLGHNSIVLPSVKRIGRGAVVGAGAVVTKDVPKYAVVVGNPAAVIKYRFSPEIIEAIERSKWWEIDKNEFESVLNSDKDYFFNPTQ